MSKFEPVVKKKGEIKSAKITTFDTAQRYGFDFAAAAADYAESFGWIFHRPALKSLVVAYHLTQNDPSEPEYGQILFNGETEFLNFVVAKCSCGCEFATEYMSDENSALSNVTCPDCHAETQEVDDSVQWRRLSKRFH